MCRRATSAEVHDIKEQGEGLGRQRRHPPAAALLTSSAAARTASRRGCWPCCRLLPA